VRIDCAEALSLAAFAAGVSILVFYVIPRIEVAIALFDRITRGI
jgi:hypothetical protein